MTTETYGILNVPYPVIYRMQLLDELIHSISEWKKEDNYHVSNPLTVGFSVIQENSKTKGISYR